MRSSRSALTRIRSVSWLFTAKCLSDAPTPLLCRPRTHSVASTPVRIGSSEKYSKLRPPSGLRFRFTPGPSSTATSIARHSSPSASPIRRSSSGSQVEALATAGGKQVAGTPASRSPPEACMRTPCGPSVTVSAGRPADSTAVVCQKSLPLVIAACSAVLSSEVMGSAALTEYLVGINYLVT